MTAPTEIPDLSRAEYSIMKVLWRSGRQTIREVHDQLNPTQQWAYSTTKTMMDRMVKKGLLTREKFHGIFLYQPRVSRPAGLVRMVQFFADRVLETDYGTVINLFARSNTLSEMEIEELSRLLYEDDQSTEDQNEG
ncbi:MAG: BlaI/MecI/CopY family transcriptional regulator [Calditrichaeota bacterium]|nr:BlaI/MecI/CopY family transcriptional regulator [Calditrichota bacterium]MCB0291994.1 BlaI/MecI/CopY family transcriptional regulator [Calditrichota bacterium]MCB0303921.1 BlaI/MecI/CopY family transcriptional regulator [Calditrichota bacterium]MCB0312264.1 BlaI/MecI/CopY family transcriptional regulator [Calditrichota bacterium]MCB9088825.1 BlaI/MecI/CopY family transcriptional regulator [Calditrichia bacterium]